MKKFGVSLLAVSLVVFFAVPAMAEFNPYGSIRIGTFWQNVDPNVDGVDDDSDLVMPLGNYSRFGAKGQVGDISGHVELGLKGAEDANNVYQRLLYGKWDYGGGTLLVGQDYCPYTHISAQVAPGYYDLENYFIGYGCLWNSRQPQIRLNMENGFYAALIRYEKPENVTVDAANAELGVTDAETDATLPKLCVGYDLKLEGISLNSGIAYNTIEVSSEAGDWCEDIDSYLIYVNGKAALGPADLKFSVHYGQNLSDFGITNRGTTAGAMVDVAGDIEDSDCYGGYLQAAFKVDPATITVGYGYTQSENDEAGKDADEQSSYFVNAKFPVADTFFIVPEFSYYDGMEDATGAADEDMWTMGLLWQMNF